MAVSLIPGRRLASDPGRAAVLGRVAEVAHEFHELDGRRIRVDIFDGRSRTVGVAFPEEATPKIAFHRRILRSRELSGVIAHELTHLIQRPRGPCPNGERACDLFALARCGSRFPSPPAYLAVPRGTRERWPFWAPLATVLAREALRERDAGRRQYVRWWEESFGRAVTRTRLGTSS
ncbi:MAG: hypothetical protein L3J87_00485 [Thermoplasmata archaeon]|nr:hypothetical protein [Thermoplasmata archaeon]